MTVPTQGEEFSKMLHHLDEAQSSMYKIAHLTRAQDTAKDRALADGWIAMGEMMKRVRWSITELAKGKLQ
jgi:hypothetical protein